MKESLRRSTSSDHRLPLVLLLAGTSETSTFATRLAKAGYRILVSTATDIPLPIGRHARITRRTGRLNANQMGRLVRRKGIRGIVDITHPYATRARATARQVARQTRIPYLTWIRPPAIRNRQKVVQVRSHTEAARCAVRIGKPILLTIGMRNLQPYARAARSAGLKLVARVLSHPLSLAACRAAGIPSDCVVTGRGPFSVKQNRTTIRRYRIGTLVTKDSGTAGGTEAKLEAARLENCRVIVVGRPPTQMSDTYRSIEDLLQALHTRLRLETGLSRLS